MLKQHVLNHFYIQHVALSKFRPVNCNRAKGVLSIVVVKHLNYCVLSHFVVASHVAAFQISVRVIKQLKCHLLDTTFSASAGKRVTCSHCGLDKMSHLFGQQQKYFLYSLSEFTPLLDAHRSFVLTLFSVLILVLWSKLCRFEETRS